MRKITILVLTGVLLYGCSANDKAKTQGNTDADSNGMAKTAMKQNSELEMNKQRLLKVGMEYLNQAKIPEAIKVLNQAVLLDPSDASVSFVLAQTYMHFKRYDNALSVLDKIIELEPDNGEAYYFKSLASSLSGNRQQALEAAQKSVAIFQEKRDEKNFKRAVVLLRGLSSANNPADLKSDSDGKGSLSKDAVSANIFANSGMDEAVGKK